MYRYDEEFDLFLEDIGEAKECIVCNEEVISAYEHKLPEQLFKYWRELGWCAYGDGLIWMVNPAEYEEVLQSWIAGTVFEDRDDLSVIARSAFGELFIWAKRKGEILATNAHLSTLTYFPEIDENDFDIDEENEDMQEFFGGQDKKFLDYQDDNNPDDLKFKHGLFDRALEKLGPLKSDEMYGFKQNHYLGGKYLIENVDIYKIEIYYDIAKQIKDVEVVVIK
jgi:hypothetical protein